MRWIVRASCVTAMVRFGFGVGYGMLACGALNAQVVQPVSLCVVDTSAPSGLRTLAANFDLAAGDTFVTRDAGRVSARSLVTALPVIEEQPWYREGHPLEVRSGRYRAMFLIYGAARIIEASQLSLLGTIDGSAIFASVADLTPIAARLEQFGVTEIAVLMRDAAMRAVIDDFRTLYIPANAIGCRFFSLQRMEEVRKGGNP